MSKYRNVKVVAFISYIRYKLLQNTKVVFESLNENVVRF